VPQPEAPVSEPATDPRVEADRLVSIVTELLKYSDEKNYDMAEYRAEDLIHAALRVRRAVIMRRPR
jgi:hypothetical protein